MLNSKFLLVGLSLMANFLLITHSSAMNQNQPDLLAQSSTFVNEKGNNHLDVSKLADYITALNSGKKDVTFISMNLADNEKLFLKELKMQFSQDSTSKKSFGRTINIHGNMDAKNIEEFSLKSTKDLTNFFDKFTNATELGKKNGIDGPKFLSNIILEYSKKLLNEFNSQNLNNGSNCVYIMLKALKANDAFLNYKRWHYDGNGSIKKNENANLNIVGVFVGLPTIFSYLDDEARKSYNKIINNNLTTSLSVEQLTQILKHDQDNYNVNSEEYNNLQKEIDNIQAMGSSNDANKNMILNKLYRRIKVHKLVNISDIRRPAEHQIALFTKEGRNPAIHSEPNMSAARLFFALGVDKSNFLPDGTYEAVDAEAPDPSSLKQKY